MSRYVKLDATGADLPGDATGHVAVRDTLTRLIWAVATAGPMTQPDAEAHCTALTLLGHSDWRLPTIDELESIRDRRRRNPAIDIDAFPGTESDWHWSSSPVAGFPDCAWGVYFGNGSSDWDGRDGYGFVRAVRGPVPASQ